MGVKTKRCWKCKEDKPRASFRKSSARPDGLQGLCRPCDNARAGQRSKAGPGLANHFLVWSYLLKKHSAKRGIKFTITSDDLRALWISQKGLCALSGFQMEKSVGVVGPRSPTVDRVNHTKGYVSGNIRLLCHAVNALRGRMTDAETIDMARAIVRVAEGAV